MSTSHFLSLALLAAGSAWSQSVISAHSGVIHYVEGQITVDGTAVQPKFAEFPDVKPGQSLAAEDGRAEILLTPGVFLRLAEASSFRMLSNKLADTRVEILTGSAMVEVGELLADNAITLQFHDAQIALLKKGLYRLDSDGLDSKLGRLRVYEGEARVTSGSQTIAAKRGHEVEFGAVLESRNFDAKSTDAFYRWSARRAEYIAAGPGTRISGCSHTFLATEFTTVRSDGRITARATSTTFTRQCTPAVIGEANTTPAERSRRPEARRSRREAQSSRAPA